MLQEIWWDFGYQSNSGKIEDGNGWQGIGVDDLSFSLRRQPPLIRDVSHSA